MMIDEAKAADVIQLAELVAKIEQDAKNCEKAESLNSLFRRLELDPAATHLEMEGLQCELVPFRRASILSDILSLSGLPFVVNAYRAVLGRNPDLDGLRHFAGEGRSIVLTKIQMVRKLRDSAEGRRYDHSFLDADAGMMRFGRFRRSRKWRGRGFEDCLILGSEPVFAPVVDSSQRDLRFGRALEHLGDLVDRRHQSMEKTAAFIQLRLDKVSSNFETMLDVARAKADREELREAVKGARDSISAAFQSRAEEMQAEAARKFEVSAAAAARLEENVRNLESQARQHEAVAKTTLRLGDSLAQLKEEVSNLDGVKKELGDLKNQLNTLSERIGTSICMSHALHEKLYPGQLDEYLLVDAPPLFAIAKSKSDFEIGEAGASQRDDAIYLSFENAFYNSEHIRKKQSLYLPYLEHAQTSSLPFLDLGCGRGEFLQILRENCIEAEGVEMNVLEAKALQRQDYRIHNEDLFSFLERDLRMWSGISLIHVIEHLSTAKVIDLFDQLDAKMEKGGSLIIETINPHCPLAFASFYMDHTHVKPYAPEVIAYHMQRVGFVDVKILYTNLINHSLWSMVRERNYHDFGVVGIKP